MAAYATVADVDARYENKIPTARAGWVATLVQEAIDTLDGLMPTLRTRVDSGQVPLPLVRKVVVDAVLWVVRAPAPDQGDQLAAATPSRQRPATNPNVISYSQADLDLLAPPGAARTVGSARLAVPCWWL